MIYLIRHASAEDAGGGRDFDRRLTVRGEQEARTTGLALRALGARPDVILSSPLVRARQTADRIAQAFRPPPPIKVVEELASGAAPETILATARAQAGEVAVVGHNPELGILTGAGLRPSSVCCLEADGEGGVRRVWCRGPEELAALVTP